MLNEFLLIINFFRLVCRRHIMFGITIAVRPTAVDFNVFSNNSYIIFNSGLFYTLYSKHLRLILVSVSVP